MIASMNYCAGAARLAVDGICFWMERADQEHTLAKMVSIAVPAICTRQPF
jgi:hypothetical protein